MHVAALDMSLELLLGPQLRAFAAAGFEVIGVSPPGPYTASLAADGIDHVPLRHASRTVAPGEDVRLGRELYGVFRRLRPDIVHTHNPKPGVLGRPAARAALVPVVVNTVHGLYAVPEDRLAKKAFVYGLERVAATCSDAELVQSVEDVPVLVKLGVPRSKIHLLGNGIDLDRFSPPAPGGAQADRTRAELGARLGDVVVGVVARLVREKGLLELFAAAEQLRTSAPHVRIVVVGPTESHKADAVEGAAVSAAAARGVRFLGLRSDVEHLYAAFDLFALPTHREGFPRAAMEAAAMGLPMVATDIRGCRQVVEHGVNGLLVPARTVRPLAEAIATLAGDAGMRAQMGAASAAKAAREFDQRRIIDVTLAVYHRLLAHAPGNRFGVRTAPDRRG